MRVTPLGSERGVVGAIAAVVFTMALGLSAIVIDVGNSWQQRRSAITATDAAALAAGQSYAHGENGCAASLVEYYIAANNDDATLASCVHVPPAGGTRGRVTVTAEVTVDFIFAPIFGIDDSTVTSSTTVAYLAANAGEIGLRPFALCLDTLNDIDPQVNGDVYQIPFGKDNPVNCAGGSPVPGNWGLLDFNGGSNSNADLAEWTEFGYDGEVIAGESIEGTPGAFSNSISESLDRLQALYDELEELGELASFQLPVYDIAEANGSNATFHVVNFVSVRLAGYKATGPAADRYLEFEFFEPVDTPYEPPPANISISVCAVDGVDAATSCS